MEEEHRGLKAQPMRLKECGLLGSIREVITFWAVKSILCSKALMPTLCGNGFWVSSPFCIAVSFNPNPNPLEIWRLGKRPTHVGLKT